MFCSNEFRCANSSVLCMRSMGPAPNQRKISSSHRSWWLVNNSYKLNANNTTLTFDQTFDVEFLASSGACVLVIVVTTTRPGIIFNGSH